MEKWLWAAGGALLGWIASQFGTLIVDYMRRRWFKRHIVGELVQLHEDTERTWLAYTRSLQICALNGVDNAHPLPLSNKVFQNYYPQALLVFSRVQRTAMELVHSYVDQVNVGIAELRDMGRRLYDSHAHGEMSDVDHDLYESQLRAQMHTVAHARWMIGYYLQRQTFPEIENEGEHVAAYRRYCDNVEDELGNIMRSVKGLTRADFERFAPKPKPLADQPDAR